MSLGPQDLSQHVQGNIGELVLLWLYEGHRSQSCDVNVPLLGQYPRSSWMKHRAAATTVSGGQSPIQLSRVNKGLAAPYTKAAEGRDL